MSSPDLEEVSINLHSTGFSASGPLEPHDLDPYWSVALGPPGFRAGQARVIETPGRDLNDGARWIWTGKRAVDASLGGPYIFRSTIDLSNAWPVGNSPIEFGVSAHHVAVAAVIVNGSLVAPCDAGKVRPSRYSLSCSDLKPALNVIDLVARAEPGDHKDHGIMIQYLDCPGHFRPHKAKDIHHLSTEPGILARAMARIPNPRTPGRSYMDLAIPLQLGELGNHYHFDRSSVITQIVSLTSQDGLRFPRGALQVYSETAEPMSMLSVRVLGLSTSANEIYLRIWCHPVPDFTAVPDPASDTMPDPVVWPTDSGVIVVVADSGSGGGGTVPA